MDTQWESRSQLQQANTNALPDAAHRLSPPRGRWIRFKARRQIIPPEEHSTAGHIGPVGSAALGVRRLPKSRRKAISPSLDSGPHSKQLGDYVFWADANAMQSPVSKLS